MTASESLREHLMFWFVSNYSLLLLFILFNPGL